MNQLEWLREHDLPFIFGKPTRLVARCESCGVLAQGEDEKYNRQKVYEFVEEHKEHTVSVGVST